MSDTFCELLESLEVPRGRILYVQSSTDWLAKAGFDAAAVLNGLREWIGTSGTLVMPSYPCRTTHLEYLSASPVFDVRRTPAAIGLIAEVFRRSGRARRSLDPDFSIVAEGVAAEALTATSLDEDPFGGTSTYARMIASSAHLVGLGVSINTNSFIHVIDSRLQHGYLRSPYAAAFQTTVVDYDGISRPVLRRALAPAFQQQTKPGEVAARVPVDSALLSKSSINGAMFFRWDLERWARWCQTEGEGAIGAGRWPCWLARLESECAAT